MRILGVDPSLANWGMVICDYALDDEGNPYITLKAATTINTRSAVAITSRAMTKRLRKQTIPEKIVKRTVSKYMDNLDRAKTLETNYKEWESLVDVVVAEVPHGAQSYISALSQGICIGIISSTSKPLIPISAYDVKSVLGSKTVSKQEIFDWVQKKHPGVIDKRITIGNHQADAVIGVYAAFEDLKELYNASHFPDR